MYLVAIAWLYVAMMMAIAEATSPIGSLLGAFFTFAFYGLAPVALLMYLLGTPSRLRARKVAEASADRAAARGVPANDSARGIDMQHGEPEHSSAAAVDPDRRGQPAAGAQDEPVAPMRKEP